MTPRARVDLSPRGLAALLSALLAVVSLLGCSGRSKPKAGVRTTEVGAAASRMIVWTSCYQVVDLTDEQLDEWRSRGVGGFVCDTLRLRALGGDQNLTPQREAALAGSQYDLQRSIRDSHIVARAARRGIDLWLGLLLVNYYNRATPLYDWFDDEGWSTKVVPAIADLAGAARTLGFRGLAFDGELYPQDGGHTTATWEWNYPGNTHSEAEVRAMVRRRGKQLMQAIVGEFPGVEIVDYYDTHFPESWGELVQQEVNGTAHAFASFVQIDFWDGLTSVSGYGPIRFLDSTFYKTWHVSGASWDTALSYNVNRMLAYLSRHLSNWSYASTRINISPFAWIDGDVANEGSFTAPRDPAYVAEQLAFFRRWAMGGVFAIYAYGKIEGGFDYRPYARAMQAAARPLAVDSEPPALIVKSVQHTGRNVVLSGSATDDTAIRVVSWQSGTVRGAAPMTATVTAGSYHTHYQWRTDWTATVPVRNGPITMMTRDLAGNTTTIEVP